MTRLGKKQNVGLFFFFGFVFSLGGGVLKGSFARFTGIKNDH